MRIKLSFLILLSCLATNIASAQKNNSRLTITGTVLDADNNPVSNAIVMIDGKNTNSVTGSKEEYKIKTVKTAQRIGIFTFSNGILEEQIEGRAEISFKFGTSAIPQHETLVEEPGDEGINTGYNYI